MLNIENVYMKSKKLLRANLSRKKESLAIQIRFKNGSDLEGVKNDNEAQCGIIDHLAPCFCTCGSSLKPPQIGSKNKKKKIPH